MSWTMGNLNYWNELQAGQSGRCATAILGELRQGGDSPRSQGVRQDEGITWRIRGAGRDDPFLVVVLSLVFEKAEGKTTTQH